MSAKILIEPDELRDAARRMRDARASMGDVAMRVAGGVPELPGDLRGRVESTLTRCNLDITEQREYIAAEAEYLERHAFLAERADAVPYNLMLALDGLFGFGDPPMLGERYTPPPPPAPPKREEDDGGGGIMGWVHGGLDAAGFIPVVGAIPDVINAGIYGIEGDGENAAWSLGGAIPIAGDAAKGAKMVKKGVKEAAEHGDEAVDAAKAVRKVDTIVGEGRQVRGKFPEKAGPNEVLVRRHPDTGEISYYQTYDADGLPLKRVDLDPHSKPHGGVPPPHVVEYTRHVNPQTGEVFVRKDRHVRPANPDEIPGL